MLVGGSTVIYELPKLLVKDGKLDLTGLMGEQIPSRRIQYKVVFLALRIFVITDKEGTKFWESFFDTV